MTTFIATTPSYGHPSSPEEGTTLDAVLKPFFWRSALPLSERQRGKKEGFAPLCGAAAIPMAALKTPVAPEEGTTLDAFLAGLLSDIQEKTTGRITAPRAVSRV